VFIGSLRGLHRLIPGIPSVDYSKPRVNAGTRGEYQQLYSRSALNPFFVGGFLYLCYCFDLLYCCLFVFLCSWNRLRYVFRLSLDIPLCTDSRVLSIDALFSQLFI
jgi:hypothetical protein